MSLLVLKFGGTSVATPDRLRRVAARIVREKEAGHDLVVVVSAMGDQTDDLTQLAREVSPDAQRKHPRELDMLLTAGERISMALLAMAIRDAGAEAVSLTGSQAAIITDGAHTGARIEEVRATRVREELDEGCVVIVAGFQGVSRAREVTTLGRGGSDTTAVALAAALDAERCDIYTDVDGIYTADPRKVKRARLIPRVDYDEMLELATAGAQVMHARAVEIGARYGVPIRVLSSFSESEGGGTLISPRDGGMEAMALTGLACERGHARLVLRGVPAGMRHTANVLSRMSEARVSVDTVALAESADGTRQVQLTLKEDVLAEARTVAEQLVMEWGGEGIEVRADLARLALVGSGMHGRPGVYARAFETLAAIDVDVLAVSTSAVSITLLVPASRVDDAATALHEAFGLDQPTGGAA